MGKRILLAEDSLTIQKVFELAFAQSDIALTMVDNGIDAVRLAEESAPDLVVADVTLPEKDGFQVAEELSVSAKAKACPVLILCGTLAPFDEERFKKSGARGVLFKPFLSQDLIDKVQELLQAVEEPPGKEKEETAPAAEEPWDFSDVLEEVEQETAKGTLPAAAKRGEDLLPGASVAVTKAEGGLSLGEFDVSLEELEESAVEPPGETIEERSAEAPAEAMPTVPHIEEELFTDAPGAVTDLSSAIQAVEEIGELEELEEVTQLQEEAGRSVVTDAAGTPDEGPRPDVQLPPAAPAPPSEAPGAETMLREPFSARLQEIFEKVAAETVEKVLWEEMDRISAELSARIRESVEAVAWEVIPSTAEALIREEISRIREQAEKKTP